MATTNCKRLCQWTAFSLELFSLLPMRTFLQLFIPELPFWSIIAIVFAIPFLIVNPLANFAAAHNYVTLVESTSRAPLGMYTSIALFSIILGSVFDTGLAFVLRARQPHIIIIGLYLMLLAAFHFGEFFVTSLTNPSNLSTSSFLIDNSTAYIIAISCSFVEYILEVYLFPGMKQVNLVALIGLSMALAGELIRKLAMFTAGQNFSHIISVRREPNHKLVKHGIYGYFRHPSYAGWFYWAIGTQIMMQNPICTVLFAVMSYQFFKERIEYEEELLMDFFGREYKDYKRRVRLWMPIY